MSTATFTPPRYNAYLASRRRAQPVDALTPARGVMIGLGLSSALWAGLVYLIF